MKFIVESLLADPWTFATGFLLQLVRPLTRVISGGGTGDASTSGAYRKEMAVFTVAKGGLM
jgi:hypothetical protein